MNRHFSMPAALDRVNFGAKQLDPDACDELIIGLLQRIIGTWEIRH